MPSHYTIIRYVPDPIAEEYVNIGIIAFEKDALKFKFIKDWKRVHAFGNEDISFLKEFAHDCLTKQPELFQPPIEENSIRQALMKWGNSIQFSAIRGSIKPAEQLIDDLENIFLRTVQELHLKKKVNKQAALSLTYNQVSAALRKRFGKGAENLLRKGYSLNGQYEKHAVDLAVVNHSPYIGTFAISFQVRDSVNIRNAVDAAAFAVEDVTRLDKKMQFALVAVPPTDGNESFDRANRLFKKLCTPIINPNKLNDWANHAISKLPRQLQTFVNNSAN